MKIKTLFYALVFMALAISCNDPIVDDNGEDIKPPQQEEPQPRPDEPASIKLGSRYLFAECGGAVKSVDVDVNSDYEWRITTSGEWFSAERVDNKLVVTLSASEDKLERNDIIFSSQIVAEDYDFGGGKVGDIHLIGVDRDGVFYGLDKNGSYGIAIAGVIDTVRCIVRYGVNTPGYPKFVAMMFAAYIDGQYYSLKGDIPAFNGIAELAPASLAKSAPMSFSLGVNALKTKPSRLYLDKALESSKF